MIDELPNRTLVESEEWKAAVLDSVLDSISTMAARGIVIQEAAAKLKSLGDLETVREKEMVIGLGIEYPDQPLVPRPIICRGSLRGWA
jgi:hypothetical protein